MPEFSLKPLVELKFLLGLRNQKAVLKQFQKVSFRKAAGIDNITMAFGKTLKIPLVVPSDPT
jgi:hypothetical protein